MTLDRLSKEVVQTVPLTVIVLTRDEEANLPGCLATLSRAAQVVVVDSGSSDSSRDIARSAGCTVVEQPWMGYAGQRNWALELGAVAHDWVLFVDADERVPDDAWDEIDAFLAHPDAAGGSFRRSVIFLGRPLRHGGFGTARVTRLMLRGRARYAQRLVHEHPVVDGRVHTFANALVHDDKRPFEAWLARHNEYSTLEARARHESRPADARGAPTAGVRAKELFRTTVWPRLPARPLLYFLYVYVLRRGFLDGRVGLRIASLYGFQELCVQIKTESLDRSGSAARPFR